mmetsp:Transcript_36265/g.55451  ORF Transcript_36265/g.55451 Transcript_36265/m.55451 type:complete len:378 (+) Transcript_36265:791-1924(+)
MVKELSLSLDLHLEEEDTTEDSAPISPVRTPPPPQPPSSSHHPTSLYPNQTHSTFPNQTTPHYYSTSSPLPTAMTTIASTGIHASVPFKTKKTTTTTTTHTTTVVVEENPLDFYLDTQKVGHLQEKEEEEVHGAYRHLMLEDPATVSYSKQYTNDEELDTTATATTQPPYLFSTTRRNQNYPTPQTSSFSWEKTNSIHSTHDDDDIPLSTSLQYNKPLYSSTDLNDPILPPPPSSLPKMSDLPRDGKDDKQHTTASDIPPSPSWQKILDLRDEDDKHNTTYYHHIQKEEDGDDEEEEKALSAWQILQQPPPHHPPLSSSSSFATSDHESRNHSPLDLNSVPFSYPPNSSSSEDERNRNRKSTTATTTMSLLTVSLAA